ncbi:hypothetical protein V1280_000822 [Bradyrhizobium sp. AZCC 2230]
MLRTFRGACLICLCILGLAVIMALLELVAHPILLKSTGCSWTEGPQGFICADGWVGRTLELVLNLPILFSYAQEFTLFGASAPFSRDFMILLYLFDVIFTLAMAYPLLILFAPKGG